MKTLKVITLITVTSVLLFTGCTKDKESITPLEDIPVKVIVNDFSVAQEGFAGSKSASSLSAYTNVKSITLAFYNVGGNEQYNVTQQRSDTTTYDVFGEFDCALPIGTYTMVVLGYAGNVPFTLSNATLATCNDVRLQDCFLAVDTIQVTGTSALSLSATLNRVVSRLGVVTSDVRPSEATKIRMTFAGGARNLNPVTGFAVTDTGFANTIEFSTSAGATTASASYIFLATDEQTMNVTLEVLTNADSVLFSKTIEGVPLKRNRMTILTGRLFSAEAGAGSFTINTDWLTDHNLTF